MGSVGLSLSLPLGETHAQTAVRAKEWVWERNKVRDFLLVIESNVRRSTLGRIR
jgi:hypothetical protein